LEFLRYLFENKRVFKMKRNQSDLPTAFSRPVNIVNSIAAPEIFPTVAIRNQFP